MAPQASPIVLGRYELHPAIATGGMATVHFGRLRGPVGFARTVAIKRLHPHHARDPSFAAMFMDEARLVARIQHPNVVPIFDVVAEGDELFLVMEYVHGEALAWLVGASGASGGVAVPAPIAVAIFIDVLHGLHAAHEARTAEGAPLEIVHRDVTPHNILVGIDGAARITDFGIAKATQRSHATRTGELKGKLCYVAPEQVQGNPVDRKTDIYAASVSLWEALTGRRLFVGDHEARIIERILVGASRAPSELSPGVPPALDDIVMRGLEIKPHKRFPTAREMALALEKCIALPPPSAIGAWVESRAHSELAARAALVATIERSGSSAPSLSDASAPPAAATKTVLEAPRRTSSTRRAAIALGAASALLVASAGLLWARSRAPEPRPVPTSTREPSAPTAESDWPVPTIALEPSVTSAVAPVSAPPPASRSPGAAPHPAKTSGVDDCKPPYTRDDTGRKIYKRECL